jgi:aminomethyltransferase
MDSPSLRKTPNYDMHVKYGGKVVDFGGWALSVQFSGILDEHRTVREKVGLFDVSHMGEVTVKGTGALAFLQRLVSRDLSTMADNQVYYTHMMYPNGGVVDDLMVTKLGKDDYYLVINASNTPKDIAWMLEQSKGFGDVEIKDISGETAELALQGPFAERTLQKLTGYPLSDMGYYTVAPKAKVAGINAMISRTGYTGEDGFEIFCAPKDANTLWEAIMEAGREFGIKPIGLGARDTLRFEAGMPLYGQEMDADTGPIEAGLKRFVSPDKPGFIGREATVKKLNEGVDKKLIGFELIEPGVPRNHYRVLKNGREIGHVTTGSHAPTLGKNVGMAYVAPAEAVIGNEFEVEIRGKGVRARVIKLPFYRRKR